MEINTTRGTLFDKWTEWMNPIFNLKEQERTLLAAYLTLHYGNRHRFSSLVFLDDLLFSKEHTSNQLMKKYKWSEEKFNKYFGTLKEKGFIQDYQDEDKDSHQRLNPAITDYPKNEKFSINVDFKII